MTKTIFSKVMWVGRATVFLVGLAVVLALILGVASAALGANGGNFILGQGNAATAVTSLAGRLGVDGPMLRIINSNPDADDTALDLRVQSGEAPMRVNSDKVVTSLNADKVDGQDSTPLRSWGNFNECRGPFGSSQDLVFSATCTTTVVAPTDGKLLVTGTGQYKRTGDPCQANFQGFQGKIIVPNTGGFGGDGPRETDVTEGETYGYAMTAGKDVPAGTHQVTFRLGLDTSDPEGCGISVNSFPTYEFLAVSATFVEGSGE
jgi:hypothetical protein